VTTIRFSGRGRWIVPSAQVLCSRFVVEAVIGPALADIAHEEARVETKSMMRGLKMALAYLRLWMAVVGFYLVQLATTFLRGLSRNVLGLGILLALGMLCGRAGQWMQTGWFAGDLGTLTGCSIGVAVAMVLRARLASFIGLVLVVFALEGRKVVRLT
jgi:hypothetical protein